MFEKTQEEIMSSWMAQEAPEVSIRCMAYNQVEYIAQALDGFLMQITSFPFEIVVHEDASIDGTAEIIRKYQQKYPQIIYPVYEAENQYSKHDGTITRILNGKIRGKFVANCEGDDYWIDPYKLQKQYDFMVNHQECTICYTNFRVYDQTKHKLSDRMITGDNDIYPVEPSLEEWIVYRGYTAPMTWFYRQSVFLNYEVLGSLDGTFEIFAYFLSCGKSKCMVDEVTSVYRKREGSESHSRNCDQYYYRMKSIRDVQLIMIDKYSLDSKVKEIIQCNFYQSMYRYICIVDDSCEKDAAEKYCSGFAAKLVFFLSKINIFRNLAKKLYILKH